jgi:hypothetical protein
MSRYSPQLDLLDRIGAARIVRMQVSGEADCRIFMVMFW